MYCCNWKNKKILDKTMYITFNTDNDKKKMCYLTLAVLKKLTPSWPDILSLFF